MTVDERLHDALSAYREQVTVSPYLLGRIEARLDERREPRWNTRALRPIAIAIVVVAMIAISIAVLRGAGTNGSDTDAASHRATVTTAARTCTGIDRALAQARIVFNTPAAYASVAAERADLAEAAADRMRRLDPTEADFTRVTSAIANFAAAAKAAGFAQAAAQRGDLDAARDEFSRFDGAIDSGRSDLAALGAARCEQEAPGR
jgi:hypothetical protein